MRGAFTESSGLVRGTVKSLIWLLFFDASLLKLWRELGLASAVFFERMHRVAKLV